MEINDVQTIIHLIRNGNWSTILTRAAIKDEADLKAIPILSAETLTSQAYLFWPKGSYRKKSATEFAMFVQKNSKKRIDRNCIICLNSFANRKVLCLTAIKDFFLHT